MTKPWHMARVASRRELPKPRKMIGPYSTLGEPKWSATSGIPGREDQVCQSCGYHVCSCEQAQANPPTFMEKYGQFVSPELKRALDLKAREYKFPVLNQIEYGQTSPTPFPCVFCQKTGVHDCPGGNYCGDCKRSRAP